MALQQVEGRILETGEMSVVKVELAPGVEASLGLIQVDKKALHAESEIPFTLQIPSAFRRVLFPW